MKKLLWLIPVAALGAALLDMPYGYYMLLRVLVCGTAAYLAWLSSEAKQSGSAWALGATAALYNPFVKVHLGAEIWPIANVGTIVVLTMHMVLWSRLSRRQ